MSFQAYIDNIKIKTGKTADEFKQLAEQKGLLKPSVKAGEIVAWLKEDFGLDTDTLWRFMPLSKSRRMGLNNVQPIINLERCASLRSAHPTELNLKQEVTISGKN
ncbi:DUF4287 domain-containing protein [Methyloglobulus sp.]|uniref:DUF4287 domain-containing protein n=1 Tax=Methyloglobulus sp. TaxID=2518622 RepID=UPI0039898D45